MTFGERLKTYGLGFIAGCFLVVLFFGRRNSCKNYIPNYLPEGRVIQEMKYKPLLYSHEAMRALQQLSFDTATFRTKMLPELDINFDLSDQRAKPCGQYVAFYQDSLSDLRIEFEKCKESTEILAVIPQ